MNNANTSTSSRRKNKKEWPPDVPETRSKEENFGKIKSIFEIKRPNKSPNSTLKKANSTSKLIDSATEGENNVTKERMFTRNSIARTSTRSRHKFKKEISQREEKVNYYEQEMNNRVKEAIENIEISNQMVEEFGEKLRKRRELSKLKSSNEKLPCINSTLHSANESLITETSNDLENNSVSSSDETEGDKIFAKNTDLHKSNLSYRNLEKNKNKCAKEIIQRDKRNSSAKACKSFVEADRAGETDAYRRSLVLQMDLEVEKMRLDGFIDDNDLTRTEQNVADLEDSGDPGHIYGGRGTVGKYRLLFEGISNEIETVQEQCDISEEYNSGCTTINVDDADDIAKKLGIKSIKGKLFCSSENSAIKKMFSKNDNSFNEENRLKEECEFLEGGTIDSDLVQDKESKNLSPSAHSSDTLGKNLYKDESFQTNIQFQSLEDEFGETLFDDLEGKPYFVEAYNDDGRELIIVEFTVERKAVDLNTPNSLKALKSSMKDADIVFHENEDMTLNMVHDPRDLIPNNASMNLSTSNTEPNSNRSTVYSTTSRDSSYSYDDDDEGIEMGNLELRNHENAYTNIRRETFCDNRGIVRIERIGYPEAFNEVSGEEVTDPTSPVSRNESLTHKGKLTYIIEEIKSTEKKYVEDLKKVVNLYIPYMEKNTPPHLIGKQCYIFGNIEKILKEQKKYLHTVMHCSDHDVNDIVQTFIEFEYLFKIYPKYFRNKPRADIILREFTQYIKEVQEIFKERLDLSAYLLTPIQRLGKYILFLENIQKQLGKQGLPTEDATKALEIIKRQMSKGNDSIAIESIENSPINKAEYGSFKMREKFQIIKPRRFECMVFLFENIIVLTIHDQKNMEIFNYYDSIRMNDLRIATFEDLTIHLTDFTKSKKSFFSTNRFTYVLEAKLEKIKDSWRKAIEDILWQQLYKVKENTMKMYQVDNAHRVKVPRERTKSAGSSVFYVE